MRAFTINIRQFGRLTTFVALAHSSIEAGLFALPLLSSGAPFSLSVLPMEVRHVQPG